MVGLFYSSFFLKMVEVIVVVVVSVTVVVGLQISFFSFRILLRLL